MICVSVRIRSFACATAAVVFSLVSSHRVIAADPPEKPDPAAKRRLMIVPFENISPVHMNMRYEVPGVPDGNGGNRFCVIDRFSEAPRAELEETLTNLDGVTVCERTRVDAVLQEQQFGALKGIADEKTACAAGKVVGASTIIIGTVTDLSGGIKEFHGNGVNVVDYTANAAIQVRVVDIETSTLLAKKTFKGTSTSRLATGQGGTDHAEVEIAAINDAMDQVGKDKEFLAKIAGDKPAEAVANITLNFAPTPANADVLIDDTFVGSAPTTYDVPAGKKVKITLRKAGYTEWEANIMPRAGMKIAPDLEKKAP